MRQLATWRRTRGLAGGGPTRRRIPSGHWHPAVATLPDMGPVFRAARAAANDLRVVAAAATANIVAAGLLYTLLEHKTFPEGQWWSLVTGFTVGYGDQHPSTPAGRALGAWLIVSFFLLALLLGAHITTRLIVDRDAFTHEEQEQIKSLLVELRARLDAADIGEDAGGHVPGLAPRDASA